MLMIGHSLFSLPFALAALLYASGGRPGWRLTILTALAFFGARNAANALNRVVDRKIDAANPRTAARHIPSGAVSPAEGLAVAAAFAALLAVSAWLISPLCFYLIPIPAALIVLYSFTKRFTWLCHLVLGVASAAAAAGGWIAATGGLSLKGILLAAANGSWVTGFDLVYQTLDAEWDRKNRLHSVAADFGVPAAKAMAALCHVGMLGFMACFGLLARGSAYYWTGFGLLALLLVLEHFLARGQRDSPISASASPVHDRRKRILLSSYSLNQVFGPLVLLVSCADLYLGRAA
jgi:4-hydroxybenzoate polyprenyltransferase